MKGLLQRPLGARSTRFARRSLRDALAASFGAWLDDRAPTLAGALAFSTIFALAPLFVIIMALLGHS